MATVTTTKQELGDSRVRVDVEVASDALERALQQAASALVNALSNYLAGQ